MKTTGRNVPASSTDLLGVRSAFFGKQGMRRRRKKNKKRRATHAANVLQEGGRVAGWLAGRGFIKRRTVELHRRETSCLLRLFDDRRNAPPDVEVVVVEVD